MAGSSPPAAIQLHQLQELLLSLPAPDPTLFADVSEAPCSAPLDAAAAAAATTAAARHVRSLTALVEQLSALQLGLEALLAAAAEVDDPLAPPRSGGGARFVELPSDAPPSDLVAQLVLAAALYGPDPRLDRPWAVLPAAEAAQGLLLALAAKLEPEAPGEATAEAAAHQQQQQLLALAAPLAAQRLRPVLGALAEHGRRPATRLEPFTGPGSFERCVAAGQLAWLVRQLGPREAAGVEGGGGGTDSGCPLATATPSLLPLVRAAVEDASPPVQACGLWGLQHLTAAAMGDGGGRRQAAALRPHSKALMAAAQHALPGCAEASWPAAAAAAIAVVCWVQGGGGGGAAAASSQAYYDLMSVLLDEGERCAHLPGRAIAWLEAAPQLFPCLGLQLVAHFRRLMPLLLGWCEATSQARLQTAALAALLQAECQTWPRMAAHAGVVWRVLRRVHASAPSSEAPAVANLALDCGQELWRGGGPDFQLQLMTAKDSAADELLQAVMHRVEEEASVAAEASSSCPTPMDADDAGAAAN